eukprot:1393-Heterococcus_DN1.PRE.3
MSTTIHTETKQARIAELEALLEASDKQRRRMHNQIQELRGNVRVYVRTRPFLPTDNEEQPPAETAQKDTDRLLSLMKQDCGVNVLATASCSARTLGEPTAVRCSSDATTITVAGGAGGTSAVHSYVFDHVFAPSAGQEDVFSAALDYSDCTPVSVLYSVVLCSNDATATSVSCGGHKRVMLCAVRNADSITHYCSCYALMAYVLMHAALSYIASKCTRWLQDIYLLIWPEWQWQDTLYDGTQQALGSGRAQMRGIIPRTVEQILSRVKYYLHELVLLLILLPTVGFTIGTTRATCKR